MAVVELAVVDEPPDLREQVGRAVNASRLVMRPEVRGPADLLVALGGASQALREGWTNRDGKVVGKDRSAASLSPLLWRLKFGRDNGAALEAAELLSARIRAGDQRFVARRVWPWPRNPASHRVEDQRRHLMAACVIREWCHETCSHCAGVGRQQVVRGHGTRKARRSKVAAMGRAAVPGTVLVRCNACQGTGRALVIAAERAQAIGVTLEVYRERWQRRFDRAEQELRRVVGRLDGPLKRRLRR